MKNLRQLCAGLALMLAFAVTAFAGDIDCTGITSQAPQVTSTAVMMEYAAVILQSVLSLS